MITSIFFLTKINKNLPHINTVRYKNLKTAKKKKTHIALFLLKIQVIYILYKYVNIHCR
jgi:hypothetical protein